MREKLVFEVGYVGTQYSGWQRQNGVPGDNSVQEAVEKTIAGLSIGERVTGTVCSGRTDKGVHAIRQTVTINVHKPLLTVEEISMGFAKSCPEELFIWPDSLQWVERSYDPKRRSNGKTYAYLLISKDSFDSLNISPEDKTAIEGITWVVDMDLHAAKKEARSIVKTWIGQHDFNNYSSHCEGQDTIRTVTDARFQRCKTVFPSFSKYTPLLEYLKKNNVLWEVRVTADGFLRHMVRRLVGALFLEMNLEALQSEDVHLMKKMEDISALFQRLRAESPNACYTNAYLKHASNGGSPSSSSLGGSSVLSAAGRSPSSSSSAPRPGSHLESQWKNKSDSGYTATEFSTDAVSPSKMIRENTKEEEEEIMVVEVAVRRKKDNSNKKKRGRKKKDGEEVVPEPEAREIQVDYAKIGSSKTHKSGKRSPRSRESPLNDSTASTPEINADINGSPFFSSQSSFRSGKIVPAKRDPDEFKRKETADDSRSILSHMAEKIWQATKQFSREVLASPRNGVGEAREGLNSINDDDTGVSTPRPDGLKFIVSPTRAGEPGQGPLKPPKAPPNGLWLVK